MKRLLSILLIVLLLPLHSCVKDDVENCAGYMHFYFSYLYGGTNRYFETVTTPTHLLFYKGGIKYRENKVAAEETNLHTPFRLAKSFTDVDNIDLIGWSQDEHVDYVEPTGTPEGEGYVRLKEITAGSGICRPVNDLLYAHTRFDASTRLSTTKLTVPFVRAICRVRITMIPQSVQGDDAEIEDGTRAGNIIPNANDYTFHLLGTRCGADYNNQTLDEKVILAPETYYDEVTGNVRTIWFGSFSSMEEFLKVKVFIRDTPVASFDCEPIGVASVPGNFVDLVIDGRYIRPQMEVKVNGWRIAIVHSNI